MPIKSRVNDANPTPSASSVPQPSTPASPRIDYNNSPSVFDDTEYDDRLGHGRFQKLGNLLGMGTRAVGGWLSNIGGLAGAGIGAGAEGIAQGFENISDIPRAIEAIPDVTGHLLNSDTRMDTIKGFLQGGKTPLARIGLEGALSTVPGHQIVSSGRAAQSAVRSGALSGVGNAARQYTTTGEIDPLQVAGHTAFGAATGGLLGSLGGPESIKLPDGERRVVPHSSPMPVPMTPAEAEAAGMSARMSMGIPHKTSAGPTIYPPAARPMTHPDTGVPVSKDEIKSLERLFSGNMSRLDATQAAKITKQNQYGSVMAKEVEREIKAAEEAAKDQRITDELIAQGRVPGTPSMRDSVSAKLPDGSTRSMSTPWIVPEAEEGIEAVGGATPVAPSTVRPIDPTQPVYLGEKNGQHFYTDSSNKIFPGPPPGSNVVPEPPPVVPPANPDEAYAEALAMLGGKKTPSTPKAPRTPRPKTSAEFDAQARAMAGEPPVVAPPAAAAPVPPVVPDTIPGQSTHPSFYDEGFEGLEEAAPRVVPPTPSAPVVSPPESPVAALANFFKSRVDAMGSANRGIKAAKAAGENVPEAGRAAVGKGLQSEAKAAGLPVGKQVPQYGTPAPPPAAPVTTSADEIAAAAKAKRPIGESADAAQIKELQDFLNKFGGEKGATQFETLAQLFGALGGGLYGAANPDENESRFGSAVKGALGGLAIGSLPRFVGAARGMDPESIRQMAVKIAERIPEIQRANYLASGPGLAANAAVGPMGSGITSSIEAMLKGDERGLKALQEIAGIRYGNVKEAFTEAGQHIGRAETRALGEAPTNFDKVTAFPGHLLTTGDVTIRQALLRAGFSDDEARLMTMTNEPGNVPDPGMLQKAVKATANYTRQGGPIINTMLPFARTPLNMLEQGIPRTPGLGAIYSFFRGDKGLRDVAVEQGLGTLAGVGGYMAGANMDPETAKFVRRFISNASGRYALPSGLGFAMGQASNQTNPNMFGTIGRGIGNAIPLPTTDVIEGWAKTANDLGNGELNLPAGSYPKFLDELFGSDPQSSATSPLPSNLPSSGIRSRGRY